MFLKFKEKQCCHFCGDFGEEVDKNVFFCRKCNTVFNEFGFTSYTELREFDDKFWT